MKNKRKRGEERGSEEEDRGGKKASRLEMELNGSVFIQHARGPSSQ